jgi:hypothetical protein
MINTLIILYQYLTMSISKKTIKQQIEKFKKSFFQSPNLPFSNFLADDDISDIIEYTPHKRDSVFTPLITLKAFIFQVLGDDGSCKQAVASVLADRVCDGKAANSVNTGPYWPSGSEATI